MLHRFVSLFFCLLLSLGMSLTAHAQRAMVTTSQAYQMVRVTGGGSVLTTSLENDLRVHNHKKTFDIGVDYERTWENSIGFAANYLQGRGDCEGSFNVWYLGGSFVIGHIFSSGVHVGCNLGVGFAANDYDPDKTRVGFGQLISGEVDYRFSSNFGVLASCRYLLCNFSDNESSHHRTRNGIDRLGLSVGICYYW